MSEILIALQGPLNLKSLRCAETFLKLEIDIIMIAWETKISLPAYSNRIKIDFIKDPNTLYTKDKESQINNRRQIIANKYLLDNYSDTYEFIVRLRNDIVLTNKILFEKELSKAFCKKKIWTINLNTTSPRLLTPALMTNHISDWFYGGSPKQLKKYLQLDDIDENCLIASHPRRLNNLIFWRNAQNEQAVWRKSWSYKSKQRSPKLLINKPWEEISIKRMMEYAEYLNKNFYISAFRKSGIQSSKYKCTLKTWYFKPYNLFVLNSIEIFLLKTAFHKVGSHQGLLSIKVSLTKT